METYEMSDSLIKFLNEIQKTMINEIDASKINDTEIPIMYQKEDRMNPKLGNSITRLVIVDSQYCLDTHPLNAVHYLKETILTPNNTDTDITSQPLTTRYTCHFSEPIQHVLSYCLYSYTVPYTYYNVESFQQNNSFQIIVNNEKIKITIPDGNYGFDTLTSTINQIITNNGFTNDNENIFASMNSTTSKIAAMDIQLSATLKAGKWLASSFQ
jgi:hypothetical protein